MKSNIVGEKIKALVQTKNLALDDVAERSGLTKEQIEIVIESETIPSLSPIIKIARALGVRLGTFLDDAEETGAVIQRKSAINEAVKFSSQLSTANSHLDFYSLAATKAGRHIEPFIVDIKPSETNDPILSSHEGEEFLYVLQGNIKIIYGKDTYILSEGDSIFYDSIVKHLVSAVDTMPAKILAVVYTPF
jgi:transcriptional regulator with XRE-family HTH domain